MEIWRDIKGFETYKISNLGNVKNSRNMILKPGKNTTVYLQASLFLNGKCKKVLVHRLVAYAFITNEEDLEYIDHIDGNPLNNNVENLRYCTLSQNQGNRRKQTKEGTSKYKGVYWNIHANKWIARLQIARVSKYLGLFDSEEDAANAYDTAATEHFKEFKYLNFQD